MRNVKTTKKTTNHPGKLAQALDQTFASPQVTVQFPIHSVV